MPAGRPSKETNARVTSDVGDLPVQRTDHHHDFAVGDRFTWHARPVELVDLASLDGSWHQVVLRLLDNPTQPPVSMPFDDLIAGLDL
jgi:hypothetical protein